MGQTQQTRTLMIKASWVPYETWGEDTRESYRLAVVGGNHAMLARVWESRERDGQWYACTDSGSRYMPSLIAAQEWCESLFGGDT